MRLLFELDLKDYDINGTKFVRPSARAVIIRDGLIAMVHSIKYDYYKFPGGGIKTGESPEAALIRETAEETGLSVIPHSVKEYGYVHRIQKGCPEDVFIQDNYYYFCDISQELSSTELDDYEAEEGFTLEFVSPMHAIDVNRNSCHEGYDPVLIEREAMVLKLLMAEGYFGKGM